MLAMPSKKWEITQTWPLRKLMKRQLLLTSLWLYTAFFWLGVESNPGFPLGFTLRRNLIGLEISCHSLSQSHSKLKPVATRSLAFSRASGSLLAFTLSFDWLIVTFSFLLIGCSNYLVLQHSIHMRFIYRCLAPKRYVRVEIGSDKQSVTKCMGRGGGGRTVFNCLLMKV